MLWQNILLRAEYLYVNLGSDSFNVVAVPLAGVNPAPFRADSNDMRFLMVRVGVSYKFGGYAVAPAVYR
jgi:opacity protein-like surface antigen